MKIIGFFIRRQAGDSEDFTSPSVQKAYAKLCSCLGIFFNILLFAVKLASGLASGSAAIVADGFNNLSDAAASAVSFMGFCLAGIGAGENHRFGHGRYEWIMGFLSALAVFLVGITLAKNSISAIFLPNPVSYNWIVLGILIFSILVKFYMYLYNRKIGERIHSSSMKATASDCISDMAATLAITVSLVVERLTGWHTDGWCGLLVSLFITFSGFKSMMEVVERFMGQPSDKDLEEKITSCVMQYPEIQGIHDLTVHDYGMGHYAVSMHIEGNEGEDWGRLQGAAQEISYKLYSAIGCDVTIQADLMVADQTAIRAVSHMAKQVVAEFETTAVVKELHIVKSCFHSTVYLTIAGPKRMQKQESALKQSLDAAIGSLDDCYQVVAKLFITSPNRG